MPLADGWGIRGEGNSRLTATLPTQKEAVARARDIATNNRAEVIIQGQDHRIRERNSYGNDPCPPRG